MSLDPTIREQTYQYFLQEAPELLQAIEQGLLQLRENWGINQANNLMRATHTLKGAATSVGLETIARIAHSLEDIFKTLCQPNLSPDPEVEALLFEGLECLRLPLMAELNGSAINDTEVLNRTASIFARLQEKLGDCFGQEAYLPTSADLGFDLTQSMFEVGVAQRLAQMATILAEAEATTVAIEFQTHADVLLGLAESLNLAGFAEIARATIVALNAHPEQAIEIAETALADFQAGHAAVLAGDRTQGGEPSIGLQQFAAPSALDLIAADLPAALSDSLLESIWGSASADDLVSGDFISGDFISGDFSGDFISGDLVSSDSSDLISAAEPDFSGAIESAVEGAIDNQLSLTPTALPSEQILNPLKDSVQKDTAASSPSIRVAVKHLDRFNYMVGELVTSQNRQSLQTEQLQTFSKTLLNQIRRHQQFLNQLQEQVSREANQLRRTQAKNGFGLDSSASGKSARRSKKRTIANGLDEAGADSNAELMRSLLDQTVQLSETAETIRLLTEQANQQLEKQHQLLTSTQSALIEARMLPLSEIFGRFPHTLQQLETLHSKPVALMLNGGEVLVDKTVAEKLFDPLLHLVRNAFDHGIEPTAVRQQRGKATKGQITLSAYHRGRYLVIEVQDDGKGLNFDQVRQKAVERQRWSIEEAARLSQEQLTDLLFEPGFSTASQVSDLSGRGVGLDVVRTQLAALQGKVTVRSVLHQGTTFILQIPLNLTIAQLFVCEANGKTYALLDDTIEQIVMPRSSQLQERNGGKFLRWSQGSEEMLVPIYALSEALDYESPAPVVPASSLWSSPEPTNAVILIRCQEQILGLGVDRLIGEQKLVIRPLGAMIHPPQYVQGATTLADGRLSLVIDATTLLERAIRDEQDHRAATRWVTPEALMPAAEPLLLAESQPSLPAPIASELQTIPNQRVLVIEDSLTTRQSLVLTLEKAGYQVVQAQDGREGLDRFQQQPHIQLVICDIEMPRMNGFEFLRHRQQIPELASVPILILSSRSDEKHRTLASQLGATVYMVKPFMDHKLLKMVTTLLQETMQNAAVE